LITIGFLIVIKNNTQISTISKIIQINISNWIRKLFKLKIIPYKVLINLTDLCNSRCNFCDIWKIKPENEINLTNIEKFFKEINKNLIS